MAKLKFKDENDNFIPVVQDVKVNGVSVFDDIEANINLKTINSQSIVGTGNITIEFEETDPIFSNSPSASITAQDINNWDNKADTSKKKTLTNSSSNYSVSNNVVTVTDNDVSTNTNIELYPADITTETWLENNLASCIITEASGSFSFSISASLPATFSMYYIITEVQ